MNIIPKEIGKRLRALREKHGLTRDKLVEKIEVKCYSAISTTSIQRYEDGEILPKIDNLICFAEFFDTTLDYIIFGKETSNDNSFTYYDNFKRINRLIYSLSAYLAKDDSGKCHLIFWEEEFNRLYERLDNFAGDDDYDFLKRGKDTKMSLETLDSLIEDFREDKEQLLPTPERLAAWSMAQGINPLDEYNKRVAQRNKAKNKTAK